MGMREEAEKILKKAYAVASYNPESTCTHEELIDYVIDNTHLTYKYVLFTALLSKATDEKNKSSLSSKEINASRSL